MRIRSASRNDPSISSLSSIPEMISGSAAF
jgi:hypothetical protein